MQHACRKQKAIVQRAKFRVMRHRLAMIAAFLSGNL
jgi:hypothetical protein